MYALSRPIDNLTFKSTFKPLKSDNSAFFKIWQTQQFHFLEIFVIILLLEKKVRAIICLLLQRTTNSTLEDVFQDLLTDLYHRSPTDTIASI